MWRQRNRWLQDLIKKNFLFFLGSKFKEPQGGMKNPLHEQGGLFFSLEHF